MASPPTSGQENAEQRALLCLSARTTALDYGKRKWSRKSNEGMRQTVLEDDVSLLRGGVADFAVPDGYWVYVFQKSATGWRLRHELKRSGSGYAAADWKDGVGQHAHAALTGAAAQPAVGSKTYKPNRVPFTASDQHVLLLSRIRLPHARVQHYLTSEVALQQRGTVWLPEVHGRISIDTQQARSKQYRPAALLDNLDKVRLTSLPARRLVEVEGSRVERCWVPLREPLTYAEDLRVYQHRSLVWRAELSAKPEEVKLRAYSELLYGAAKRSKKARAALEYSKLATYARTQQSIVSNAEQDAAVSTGLLVHALSSSAYASAIRDHAGDPEHEAAAAASYADVSAGCLYDKAGLAYLASSVVEEDDGLIVGFLYGSAFQAWRKQAAAVEAFQSMLASLAAGETVRLTRKHGARKALQGTLRKLNKALEASVEGKIFSRKELKALGSLRVSRRAQHKVYRITADGIGSLVEDGARNKKALAKLDQVGGRIGGVLMVLELANLTVAASGLPGTFQRGTKGDQALAVVGVVGSFADFAGAAELLIERSDAGEKLLKTALGQGTSKSLSVVGAVCDYVGGVVGAAGASYKGQAGQATGHAVSALAAVALGSGGVLSSGAAGAAGAVAFGLTGPALLAIGAVLFAVGTAVLWLTEEDPPLVQHAKQSPWRTGAVASEKPTGIKESTLNAQMDQLLHLLVRYKADVTLKRQQVKVDGQRSGGLLLSAEVTANMLLRETRFTIENVTLYRVGYAPGRDEVIEVREALPPEEALVFAKQTFTNVRQRAFHSKALIVDTSAPVHTSRIDEETMLGIWEARSRPKGEALIVELALPIDYLMPASELVEDPYTREMRPGPPVQVAQLKAGFMGLKWKGKHYGADLTLQALPISHMAPITVKSDATTY